MSPTLLEGAVAIVLIVVAWQLGLILAPALRRAIRRQMQALDEAFDETDDESAHVPKEKDHGRLP